MKKLDRKLRRNLHLFVLIILCSCVQVHASADDCPPAKCEVKERYEGNFEKRYGDFSYVYCEEYKGIVILKYFGKKKTVRIPETIDGIPVKELANWSFAENKKAEKFIIPDTVVRIGDFCFENCTKLKEIRIPEGVLKLNFTFVGCTELRKVTLPESLIILESCVFEGCKNLKKITIPDKVRIIGVECFYKCTNLQTVKMPKELRKIERKAFEKCKSLKQIVIPNKTNNIEYNAFADCTSLKKVILLSNILSIEKETFKNCRSLEQVAIPERVHYIEKKAFMGCSSLKKIRFLGSEVSEIRPKVFWGIHSKAVFDVPKKAVKKYKAILDKTTGFLSTMKVK